MLAKRVCREAGEEGTRGKEGGLLVVSARERRKGNVECVTGEGKACRG